MLNQAKDILLWYDGMKKVVPDWYRENNGGHQNGTALKKRV